MTCPNCDSSLNFPGRLIKVNKELNTCAICGEHLPSSIYKQKWDSYFLGICNAVAVNSPCLSRHIGAILVRDHSILSTGYNGPARGVPHCQNICPRRAIGHSSGEGLDICPAQHAEENCISNAARLGVSVADSTLYMNFKIPCKNCLGTLINAGVEEVVVKDVTVYDKYSSHLIHMIKIRPFEM